MPEKRISWLAPAIRRLAAERDAKLAAELVIELIPAQREIVDGPLNYEIKIRELGTFYVALDPGQATISREPRGSIDFSLEGPVAAFSELAAGGASRQASRGCEFARAGAAHGAFSRRAVGRSRLPTWPPREWTSGRVCCCWRWPRRSIDRGRSGGASSSPSIFRAAPGIVIYVRVCDGEPCWSAARRRASRLRRSRSADTPSSACLRVHSRQPQDRTLVTGDATSVDMFLQWTARAQGLTVADA